MGKSRLNIGQKVEIRTEPDGEVYASMIQELEAETVTISLPVLQGRYLLLQPGERVTVEFCPADAVYTFETVVVGRKKHGELSLLLLARPSAYKRKQRRELFRLPVVLPCSFRLRAAADPGGKSSKKFGGKIKDLSGRGLKLSTSCPVKINDVLIVSFALPGNEEQCFTLQGTVRWCEESEERMITAGVEFTEVSPEQEEQIINYIFAQQRQSLRLLRGRKND
jgi:c-di-GMP-binding flagellar brake protein YcgR